ncbi:CCD42 protein, partial [Rhinopomastus cyanomelas]|nr:CCD42 protein [Rhinopomastus cyanomelas]
GRTVPSWDAAMLSLPTSLLLKRRELAEVEQALQSQQEEFQQRMESLMQRWNQLGQRGEQLQDAMLKFHSITLTLSSYHRLQEWALQRADEEQAQVAGKSAEAHCLHEELLGHRECFAQRVRSLCGFSDYLWAVLARMG